MRTHLPSLNQLKAFEATARHLSFSKAAEELHVTHAAVSHQVKALEGFLQARLFYRLTRSIELTEEALAYYLDARQALDIIEASTSRFFEGRINGLLKISVAPSFASRWLLPRLNDFRAEYPKIEIEIQPSIELTNFQNSDIDLAIRHGDGNWPGLESIKLFDETLVPVAAPELSHTLDKDFHRQETLIGASPRTSEWSDWITSYSGKPACELNVIFYPTQALALDAAVGGGGIALADYRLIEKDVLAGRLVVLEGFSMLNNNGFYLSYRNGPIVEYKIKVFRDWITDKIILYSVKN